MLLTTSRALQLSAVVACTLIARARALRRPPRPSGTLTILGLGSLLSERSCRVTFPTLTNFRLARLHGYRRVFAHSPAVFVARGITNGLQMASLSAEPCAGASFVVTAFEVPDDEGLGMEAFREREEEFELIHVPFTSLEPAAGGGGDGSAGGGVGMLCMKSTDGGYLANWGQPLEYEAQKPPCHTRAD